jgi:hypothetical protein
MMLVNPKQLCLLLLMREYSRLPDVNSTDKRKEGKVLQLKVMITPLSFNSTFEPFYFIMKMYLQLKQGVRRSLELATFRY